MMENPRPEEENIIKDIKILFRREKIEWLRDVKNTFEHEEEQEKYYKPVTISNFWSNDYIK